MTIDHLARMAFGVVVGASVRALVLAVFAAVLLALVRPRAAFALGVWTFVLGVALLTPVIVGVAPGVWAISIPVTLRPEAPVVPAVTVTRVVPLPVAAAPSVVGGKAPTIVPPATQATAPAGAPSQPIWPGALLAAYAMVALLLLGQIAVGARLTTRLRRRAHTIDDEDAVRMAVAQAVPSARVPRCAIAESDAVIVPITAGCLRPVVILPIAWRSWPAATLASVVTHELSHVRRGDAWRQCAARVYRAAFWLNPLAWWLSRTIAHLAERASDDAVIEAGMDPAQYADVLMTFFATLAAGGGRADWSLAMANGRDAEKRLARVLDARARRSPTRARRWVHTIAVAITVAIGVIVSAATPVATAVGFEAPAFRSWTSTSPGFLLSSAPSDPLSDPPANALRTIETGAPAASVDVPQQAPALGRTPAPGNGNIAPTLLELAGNRRVLLAFDLAHLPGDTLDVAKATASWYVDGMSRRADVGLDVVHLWSALPLGGGSSSRISFVRETSEAHRQIDAVRPPASASDVGEKDFEALCSVFSLDRATPDDLARDQVPIRRNQRIVDSKLVLLFTADDARTPSGADVLSASTACEGMGIAFMPIPVQPHAHSDSAPRSQGATPPTAQMAPISARQITLLFDTTDATGTARDIDIEQSVLLVERMMEQTRIGRDISHVFAVATLSDHVDVVVRPTDDPQQLRAGLIGLAKAPVTNIRMAARLDALAQYCGTVGRDFYFFNDPQAPHAVVYYGAVDSPLAAAESVTLLMAGRNCQQAHVEFAFGRGANEQQINFVARAIAAPPLPVTFVDRADSPMTFGRAKSVLQAGYVSTTAHNGGSKVIVSMTLQAILRDKNGKQVGDISRRAGPTTSIAPGASAEIASLLVDADALRGVGTDATVEVSVTEVDFADGTVWKAGSRP